MEKRYLKVMEIADYLSMSKPSIYRYVEERKIPYCKIGKTIRFDILEIDKWLKEFKRDILN